MTTKEAVGLISEKTNIPLGLVVAMGGLITVLVLWGKGLEARVENHISSDEAATLAAAKNIQAIKDDLASMRTDIAVIKVEVQMQGKRQQPWK